MSAARASSAKDDAGRTIATAKINRPRSTTAALRGAADGLPQSAERERPHKKPIAPRAAPQKDGLVSMREAVTLLGLTRSGIRGLIRTGKLAADKRDGVHYFERAELVRLALERGESPERFANAKPSTAARGETAALAFTWLREQVSPVDLVIRLKLPAEDVRRLVAEYEELRALDVKHTARCARCNEQPARFCAGCVATASPSRRAGGAHEE